MMRNQPAVRVLEDRWPRLKGLPRIDLATLPTPVQRLDALSKQTGSDLWIKRDDLTAPEYGGNKVRKLEYLLGEAQRRGAEAVLTAGAVGSHHVLTTALYAPRIDLEVHAVMVPQPWSEHVEQTFRATLATGAQLYPAGSIGRAAARALAVAGRLRMAGDRPFVVPQGGSSPVGAAGYVAAGVELAAQIDAGDVPEPEAIYVAAGTAGTAVGLAVGLAAAGLTTPVIAVRVVDRTFLNRATLHALTSGTVHRLRALSPHFPPVAPNALRHLRVDGSEVGDGYGHPTTAAEHAVRLARDTEGLTLDLTYTGKALAAMLRDAEVGGRRLLYWHTLSSAPLAPLLADAPPVPAWALKLARGR
jgi:1-aminocyclopropane-1-carboxylate deaminase/D-cysteine desulfhydrase-like pyridoxal-dependent ACC family enzyme